MATENNEDRLVASLLSRLPSTGTNKRILAGAGMDDCAVVRPIKRTHRELLKTDCVIEGVHYPPDTPPEFVGWKALCRPLSDIAATGGKPRYALVTLGLNRGRSAEWAAELYAGIGKAAQEFGVTIVGGETASSLGPCFVSVTLTGSVRRDRCITRMGGKIGDLLYVTGQLGGSFPSGKHLHFRPRLEEARWLTRNFLLHAMMDLSDGLSADLPRLAQASGTGYWLEPAAVPRTEGCTLEQALSDGEDYELLFSLSPKEASKLGTAWANSYPHLSLTCVGELQESGLMAGLGQTVGYDHFANWHTV